MKYRSNMLLIALLVLSGTSVSRTQAKPSMIVDDCDLSIIGEAYRLPEQFNWHTVKTLNVCCNELELIEGCVTCDDDVVWKVMDADGEVSMCAKMPSSLVNDFDKNSGRRRKKVALKSSKRHKNGTRPHGSRPHGSGHDQKKPQHRRSASSTNLNGLLRRFFSLLHTSASFMHPSSPDVYEPLPPNETPNQHVHIYETEQLIHELMNTILMLIANDCGPGDLDYSDAPDYNGSSDYPGGPEIPNHDDVVLPTFSEIPDFTEDEKVEENLTTPSNNSTNVDVNTDVTSNDSKEKPDGVSIE